MNKKITTGNSTEGIEVINTKRLAYVAPEKPVITLATADTIKDTAIAFAEWTHRKDYTIQDNRWFVWCKTGNNKSELFPAHKTTEQLYEQFLKEKV